MSRKRELNRKPLYQPWNEEEFQADVFVRGMTWLQRHFYGSLLRASFFHGTRPYLPNDDNILWVLAGAACKSMWMKHKNVVLSRFTAVGGRVDLIENKRVTADWYRLVLSREIQSEKGKKSAAVRDRKQKNEEQQQLNSGSTAVEQVIDKDKE